MVFSWFSWLSLGLGLTRESRSLSGKTLISTPTRFWLGAFVISIIMFSGMAGGPGCKLMILAFTGAVGGAAAASCACDGKQFCWFFDSFGCSL